MRGAVLADIVNDCGSVLGDFFADGAFAVKNSHGILFKPAEAGGAKLVLSRLKIFSERLVIILATFGAAD